MNRRKQSRRKQDKTRPIPGSDPGKGTVFYVPCDVERETRQLWNGATVRADRPERETPQKRSSAPPA